MAHLWVRNDTEPLIEVALDGTGVTLATESPSIRRGCLELGDPSRPFAWLLPALFCTTETWVLICGSGGRILVNGISIQTGVRVLGNRDEIRCPSGSLIVFSDERVARIERFPEGERRVRCGRCTCEIDPASPAVRCPACGSWYHEHGDFPCWTSVPFCQACGQETGLSGDIGWTPEES